MVNQHFHLFIVRVGFRWEQTVTLLIPQIKVNFLSQIIIVVPLKHCLQYSILWSYLSYFCLYSDMVIPHMSVGYRHFFLFDIF